MFGILYSYCPPYWYYQILVIKFPNFLLICYCTIYFLFFIFLIYEFIISISISTASVYNQSLYGPLIDQLCACSHSKSVIFLGLTRLFAKAHFFKMLLEGPSSSFLFLTLFLFLHHVYVKLAFFYVFCILNYFGKNRISIFFRFIFITVDPHTYVFVIFLSWSSAYKKVE